MGGIWAVIFGIALLGGACWVRLDEKRRPARGVGRKRAGCGRSGSGLGSACKAWKKARGRGEAVLAVVGRVGGELGEVLCRLRTVVVVYLEGKRRKVEAFQPVFGGAWGVEFVGEGTTWMGRGKLGARATFCEGVSDLLLRCLVKDWSVLLVAGGVCWGVGGTEPNRKGLWRMEGRG